MITVEDVLNILLPGARQMSNKDIKLDLQVDQKTKSIIVKGYSKSKKRSLGFAISGFSIANGLYKESFGPSCKKLVELLEEDKIEDGFFV